MSDLRVVWRFIDGKPGHENQSLGLIRALAEHVELEIQELPVRRGWHNLTDWLLSRCSSHPPGSPDILLGAGHATHLPMLACQRCFGGKTLVLMKPSLPRSWFDLCVMPEHDGSVADERVFLTKGVLNPVQPAAKPEDNPVLILLGGPAREYAWDDEPIVQQVAAIVGRTGASVWILGSRRTPDSTLTRLRSLADRQVKVIAQEDTQPGWLASELSRASRVWVSEDSVSMVYEALTAGAACGLLHVARDRPGRVAAGVDRLVQQRLVTRFDAWHAGRPLIAPAEPFNEAARAAQWVLERV